MSKPLSENVLQDELQRLQLALQKKSRQLSRCDKILSARKHVRATLKQHGAGDTPPPHSSPIDERSPRTSPVENLLQRQPESSFCRLSEVLHVKPRTTIDTATPRNTKGLDFVSCDVALTSGCETAFGDGISHASDASKCDAAASGDICLDASEIPLHATSEIQVNDSPGNPLLSSPDELVNRCTIDLKNDVHGHETLNHQDDESKKLTPSLVGADAMSGATCKTDRPFDERRTSKKTSPLFNDRDGLELQDDTPTSGFQKTPFGRNVTFREGSPDIFFVSPQPAEEAVIHSSPDANEEVAPLTCIGYEERFHVGSQDEGDQHARDGHQSLLSSQSETFASQIVTNRISPLRSILIPFNRTTGPDALVPGTIVIDDSLQLLRSQKTKENSSHRTKRSLTDDTIDLTSTFTQGLINDSPKVSEGSRLFPPSKKPKKVEPSYLKSNPTCQRENNNKELPASLESTCLSPIPSLSTHFVLSPAVTGDKCALNSGNKRRRSKLFSNMRDSTLKSNLKGKCIDAKDPGLSEVKVSLVAQDCCPIFSNNNSLIHEDNSLQRTINDQLYSCNSSLEDQGLCDSGGPNSVGRASLHATAPWDNILEVDSVPCPSVECLGWDDKRRVLCSSVCHTMGGGAAVLLVCGDCVQLWYCSDLTPGERWTKWGEQPCQWPEVDPSSFMACCLIGNSVLAAATSTSVDEGDTSSSPDVQAPACTTSLSGDCCSVAGAVEAGAWCRFVVLGHDIESTTDWTMVLVECEGQSFPKQHLVEKQQCQLRLVTSFVKLPLYSEVQSACSGVLSCSNGPWTIVMAHSSLELGVSVLTVMELEVVHRERWHRRELLCEPRILSTDPAPLRSIQGLLRHTGTCDGVIVGLTEGSILLLDAKLDLLLAEIPLNLTSYCDPPPLSPIPSAPFPGSPCFTLMSPSRSPSTEYNTSFIRTPPSSPMKRLDFPDQESPFSMGESFFSKSLKEDTDLHPYFHEDIVRSPRTVSSNVNRAAPDLEGLLCAVQSERSLVCVCRRRDGVSCLLSCDPLQVPPQVMLGAVIPLPERCSGDRDHNHLHKAKDTSCVSGSAPTQPPCPHGVVTRAVLTRSLEVLLATDLGCVYRVHLQPRPEHL